MCIEGVEIDPWSLGDVLDYFKTQERFKEKFEEEPYTLECVPDQYITQEMCDTGMCINPASAFFLIPDHFKTQGMCIKAVEVDPWSLEYVPDCFKTQEMCDKAVRKYPSSLMYLPYWFVKQQQQVKLCYDYCDNDEIIEWYESY